VPYLKEKGLMMYSKRDIEIELAHYLRHEGLKTHSKKGRVRKHTTWKIRA
jgi:hypothetical protein